MDLPKKSVLLPIIFLIFTVNTKIAWSQEVDGTAISDNWERFSISGGAFISGLNSDITFFNEQVGAGLIIDFEDVLGLSASSFVFRSNVSYKIGKKKKHIVYAGYFGVYRKATKILDEDLALGGLIYPIGTEIKSEYDLTIIRGKYEYTFFQDSRVSIGASLGLFIMPVNFTAKADGVGESVAKFIAPLPLLGLRTDFIIAKKLSLRQSVELLYLSTSTFKGSLLDLNVLLEHKAFDHFAFGLGVDSNRLGFTMKNQGTSLTDFSGSIRTDYTGLILYGKFYL